jgi:hypothetical protein
VATYDLSRNHTESVLGDGGNVVAIWSRASMIRPAGGEMPSNADAAAAKR